MKHFNCSKKSVSLDHEIKSTMSQIGFTKKTEHIYDRFANLLLKEKQRNGRVYAPQFLDMLLDHWERVQVHGNTITTATSSQHVIIKQSDGALYLEKMLAHNHNAYLTPYKDEAMVFDSREQAKAFLRKCGHEAANWIIEPA